MEGHELEVFGACSALRFAEPLRKRWAEARAEAALQESVNLAYLEGTRISDSELRKLIAESQGQPTVPGAYVLGIWRAAWEVEQQLAPLNTRDHGTRRSLQPVPSVLAKINRNVCSYLVRTGQMSSAEVALPLDPALVARLARAMNDPTVSAIQKLGFAWAAIAGRPLFAVGSTPTAVIFGKWLLANQGVEPTGVTILSAVASQDRPGYAELVARTRADFEPGGMAQSLTSARPGTAPLGQETTFLSAELDSEWGELAAKSILVGCSVGEQVARAIQAGVFPKL